MHRLLVLLLLMTGAAEASVRVVDGDTLEINGTTYRIDGIDAPEAGQTCKTATGRDWRCGKRATDALFELVDGKVVRCRAHGADRYGRVIATCSADGRDLARVLVENGFAWAFRKYSDTYVADELRARHAKRGIWQGDAQPAWEFRKQRWANASQQAPDGCPIKGNISKHGRIYHAPWSPWYSRTKISPAKGERWFCDEAEAIAAGWRAPLWH
ncbi:MAG: thermonuclease family protein [Pseudomonadota bacterium]